MIEKNREDVRDAFFYNHLMTITNIESVERTAREIMERKLEGMQQIGPTTMLITKEGLDPALKIVYKLMKDEGLFDDLFAQLDQDELDFEIEYVSPMAQAQKYTGIQELQQLIEIAGILGGQLGYPVTDRLDGDFTLSLVADYLNVHAGVLRDMKVVKEERAAREQQQMQAAQVQQAGEFMNNAAPMVKAVSGATDNGMPALDMGGGMGGINPGV